MRPPTLATRDARRLARVLEEVGGDGAPIGSGWMACDAPGSWATYAAGLGLDGPVPGDTLDVLVDFYTARGRSAEIQVTPYQHPSLIAGLAARGFVLHETETVLARDLQGPLPPKNSVSGLRFVAVNPEDDSSVARFVRAQLEGFFPGGDAPPAMRPITRRVARNERTRLWLLEVDGALAGSGGLETYEESAVLIAGAVLPGFRRRGLQSELIRYRLAQARATGHRVALVGSLSGGPTERNALRAGFRVSHAQLGLRRSLPDATG